VPFRKEIAQYHCEQAVLAQLGNDRDAARKHLEDALDANKNCVRANVMLGETEALAGNHEAAISFWKRIEFQQPEYLGLIAAKMLASYRTLNKLEEGLELLKTYLQTYKLHSLLNVLYEAAIAQQDAEAAAKLARDELVRKPSLQTLDQLLQARLILDDSPQDAHVIQQTVRYALGNRSAYVCSQCGFRAKHYHWQCPACNAWESLPSEPSESVS